MKATLNQIIEKALHDHRWINNYDPTQWAQFECYMRGNEPVVLLRIGRIHSDGSLEASIRTEYYECGTYPYSVRTRVEVNL